MTTSKIAIDLSDVTFRYFKNGKRNVIDHARLSVEEGTITVLMGASGCGKSTLSALIAGLYPENGGYLESGSIRLFGKEVSELAVNERAKYLGFVFQNPDLQFCMDTLRSELIFCLENIGILPEEMDRRIQETARAFSVEDLLDRKLCFLSGGEKQIALLACIDTLKSRILVLDEAFANVDRENALQLLSFIRRLRERGTTIVAIDHRIDLWKDTADEFIVLGEGARILARGIHRENLNSFRDLFDREGLFEIRERKRKNHSAPTFSPQISAPDESTILRFENLTVPYSRDDPRLLLENACASFQKGTMTAILGKSGIGKTTTFLSVLKQHPYFGKIVLDGKEIRTLRKKDLYQKIGIVFQNPANQFLTQNVCEEVVEGLRIWNKGLSETSLKETAEKLLELYGLSDKMRYSPYMLSQGQQRRLAVLSVLTGGQKILLLDEPTYGQDYRGTAAIMEHLEKRIKEDGLTVIFITHDRTLAGMYADRIYELTDRRLLPVDPLSLL
ncbi:energy-coupling factor transport system ATP-binding protein [[Clostridium] aminophilum]|uniref:Energy-coupling factor transport system ATP-binding protein n=1 Tax=[Clostridium] aminophilum TaxID=1526 RepID=A0A1I0GEE7_9FIRM|nr:ABC transporter ATP-binding protein [[Clostridium] aminophilum]SET69225.1 energy-coupling factor transport system ATP-binding protein [[Clostridium] aminophilum]